MLPPPCSAEALGKLLLSKEEEWRALLAQRTQLQEVALQEAQHQLEKAREKLQRLQEDFVYNLQVLEERDQELERYQAALLQARAREEARQAEASELKIEVAKLRQELAREGRRAEELQEQQRLRLQEHHLELERLHSDKNSEMDRQREQYEDLKWKLERKLAELDGELSLQRQELLLEFQHEMQKREHEFRLRADSMSNTVLSHELKVKLLNKELEALQKTGAQAAECLQRAEVANAELERTLQGHAKELQDLEAVKDARIKDLEGELCSVQQAWRKDKATFTRKHEELDRLARERDAALVALKSAHAEQLRAVESRVQGLQAHCDGMEAQLRGAERTRAEAARDRGAVISRLREEAAALKAGWDAQVAQMSKEAVAGDLQVQALQEEEAKLKAQLTRTQQDADRYKQQLSQAVERERSLERERVQLGLDWQRRCDDIEREQIQRSEALIQGLTEARDQVAAKLQEAERALREQEVVLKAVALERDQAVEGLHAQGLLPGQEPQIPQKQREGEMRHFPSEEIQQLQEQNASLRSAVALMRREMEVLSHQMPPPAQLGKEATDAQLPSAPPRADAAPGYVLALEAEVQDLKHKLMGLEEQLATMPDPKRTPWGHPDSSGPVGEGPRSIPVTSSWSSPAPREDPVLAGQAATGLALWKLGERTRLLNLLVTQLKRKMRQKPLELVTVQRELPREIDQLHLEVLELQKQVAELHQHLRAALKEEGESWGRELLGTEGLTEEQPMGAEALASWVPRLQRKLRDAARSILHLRVEKEQLVELGNRLRTELARTPGRSSRCLLPMPRTPGPAATPEVPLERGAPLGQLQPLLTAQRQHRSPAVAGGSPCQKENRSPKPPLARAAAEQDHHGHPSSSPASSSLQDTWRLLELGSSPSSPPSQDSAPPEIPALAVACSHLEADRSHSRMQTQAALAIEGSKMATQPKARHARPSKSHPMRAKSCQQHPHIRNYNVKD